MIKRSYNYEEELRNTVGKTVNLLKKGDVIGQTSYSQSVSFENDKLNSIDDVSHSALSCRLFHEGKVGNSYVNDPNDYQQLIDNSIESARFGESLDIVLPNTQNYQQFQWMNNPKNINYSKQDLKDMASFLLKEIKKFAPNAKVSTMGQNSYALISLQNTAGFKGEYETSSLYLQGGLFELAEDDSFLELYEGDTFFDDELDFTKIIQTLEQRIQRSRQVSKLKKTGKMPVIFAPSSIDLLITPIEIAINGKTLSKDLSLFANRLNESMFDEKFTFVDDPFYYRGLSTAPFDDEGTIGEKIEIIDKGVFKNFIYDCTTAKKVNAITTGHASRGINSLPVPALSNRILGMGNHSLEEMISSIDYGLMLVMSLGEGQSNIIAGDFSVLAETAYLIENGILKGRVKDIMISGNSFELLKDISMLESKLHKESTLFTPHILLNNVTVSKNM